MHLSSSCLSRTSWLKVTTGLLFAAILASRAAPAPYILDADTLHLWHFDEPNNPNAAIPEFYTYEAQGVAFFDLLVAHGAKLEAPSYSGALEGALDTRGIPGSPPFQSVAAAAEDAVFSDDLMDDVTGAFTYEALVYLEFDPTVPVENQTLPMQIISMENEVGPRLFQFRLVPSGHPDHPSTNTTEWAMHFININGASGTEHYTALLPLTGIDTAEQGQWYHVAATYNGQEDTEGNLVFYWTKLPSILGQASLLDSFRMTSDLGSSEVTAFAGDFAIGNEARDVSENSFTGLIDEVRISDVARGAFAFNLDGTPYSADGNTLMLYHFNETNPVDFPDSLLNRAYDEVTGNAVDLDVINDASLGAPPWAVAFGSSLNTVSNAAAGAFAVENLPLTDFVDPVTGAFTFEVLVRLDFDPATITSADGVMQLLSMDNEGATDARPWQWRIEPPATAGDPLAMAFIRIAGGIQTVSIPLPTTSPHAPAQGAWYHAAVTYDGHDGVNGNLVFYWTALDSGPTSAVQLGADTLGADLAGGTGDFVVGNEARNTAGSTDNWHGLLDEVRISGVARTAHEFLFSPQAPTAPFISAVLVNPGAGTVGLTWNSQPGQFYTIRRSTNLEAWFLVESSVPAGAGDETSRVVSSTLPRVELYQVERE